MIFIITLHEYLTKYSSISQRKTLIFFVFSLFCRKIVDASLFSLPSRLRLLGYVCNHNHNHNQIQYVMAQKKLLSHVGIQKLIKRNDCKAQKTVLPQNLILTLVHVHWSGLPQQRYRNRYLVKSRFHLTSYSSTN